MSAVCYQIVVATGVGFVVVHRVRFCLFQILQSQKFWTVRLRVRVFYFSYRVLRVWGLGFYGFLGVLGFRVFIELGYLFLL
jgi:hypothetical protein